MLVAIVIVVLFIAAVIMSIMRMASRCSRAEEKRTLKYNQLFCDDECGKCDQWDWCPMSDRRG